MSDIENQSDDFSRVYAEGGEEAPAEAMDAMEAMEAAPAVEEMSPEELEKRKEEENMAKLFSQYGWADVVTLKEEKAAYNRHFEMGWNVQPTLLRISIGWGVISVILYLCGRSADTEPVNTYTQNQRNFNVFLTSSASRIVFMVFCLKKMR